MSSSIELLSLVIGSIGTGGTIYMGYLRYRDRYPRNGTLKLKKIVSGCAKLRKSFEDSLFEPDMVVGVHAIGLGGGAIVAEILAVDMNLPLHVINLDIVDDRRHNELELSTSQFLAALPNASQILLVDDICNTGRTLKAARDLFLQAGHEVKIAVIAAPPEHAVSIVEVDFWVYRTSGQIYERDWMLTPRGSS